MRTNTILTLLALAMVFFTSCSEDNSDSHVSEQSITFASGINDYQTRTTSNGDEWLQGDNVGIYMLKHGEKITIGTPNVKHTTTSGGKSTSFQAESPLYYPADGSSVDFIGYYPYSSTISNLKYPIALSDQSVQTALDLMYAENNFGYDKTNTSAVDLKFYHVLTKVIMNITTEDNTIEVDKMTVKVKGMDRTAEFNLLNKEISSRSSNGEITASKASDKGCYELILLPVESLTSAHVVEFTINDKSYTWTMSENATDNGGSIDKLEGGYRYTFNIKVSDSGVVAVASQNSGSIAPWEDTSANGTADENQAKNNFFVSTSGNDDNTGTLASPWRTIQKALNTVGPGSVVNIMGGTYYEGINVTVSGAPDKYIVVKNYNNEEVIISGNNTPKELMTLSGVSYIKIQGLTFADCLGSYSVGIKISTNSTDASHHIEVESNTFRNLYAYTGTTSYPQDGFVGAISVVGYLGSKSVNNIIIKGNTIKDCRTGSTEAIAITGNVDGFLVTKNIVTNTGNHGIDASGYRDISNNPGTDYARNGIISENRVSYCKSPFEDGAGIYLDGSSNIIVEKNISHNNVYGIIVGGGKGYSTVSNNIIRNNICYSNEACGIGILGGYSEGQTIFDCQVINNTTYGNGKASDMRYLGEIALVSTSNAIVKNNIFYSTNSNDNILYFNTEDENLKLSFNNYYCSASGFKFFWKGYIYDDFEAYKNANGNDLNSDFSNPSFADVRSFDFQLGASSPCVDTGDPQYIPSQNELDFNNNTRKVGANIDKGACEKQ